MFSPFATTLLDVPNFNYEISKCVGQNKTFFIELKNVKFAVNLTFPSTFEIKAYLLLYLSINFLSIYDFFLTSILGRVEVVRK